MSKCYLCDAKAIYTCADPKCDNQICSDHSYRIRHSIKCQDCFLRDRKIGKIKIWGSIGFLLAILVIMIILRSLGIL